MYNSMILLVKCAITWVEGQSSQGKINWLDYNIQHSHLNSSLGVSHKFISRISGKRLGEQVSYHFLRRTILDPDHPIFLCFTDKVEMNVNMLGSRMTNRIFGHGYCPWLWQSVEMAFGDLLKPCAAAQAIYIFSLRSRKSDYCLLFAWPANCTNLQKWTSYPSWSNQHLNIRLVIPHSSDIGSCQLE